MLCADKPAPSATVVDHRRSSRVRHETFLLGLLLLKPEEDETKDSDDNEETENCAKERGNVVWKSIGFDFNVVIGDIGDNFTVVGVDGGVWPGRIGLLGVFGREEGFEVIGGPFSGGGVLRIGTGFGSFECLLEGDWELVFFW